MGLGGGSEIRQTWGGACPKSLKIPELDLWGQVFKCFFNERDLS